MNRRYYTGAYIHFIIFLFIPVISHADSLESLCTFLCDCSPVSVCEQEILPVINTYVLHKKFSQQLSLQYIIHEKPEDPTKLWIYFLVFANGCHEVKLTSKQKDISVDTWIPYLSSCSKENNALRKNEFPIHVKKIYEDDLPQEIRTQFSPRALRFGMLYKTEWTKPIEDDSYLSIKNNKQKGLLKKIN